MLSTAAIVEWLVFVSLAISWFTHTFSLHFSSMVVATVCAVCKMCCDKYGILQVGGTRCLFCTCGESCFAVQSRVPVQIYSFV